MWPSANQGSRLILNLRATCQAGETSSQTKAVSDIKFRGFTESGKSECSEENPSAADTEGST